MRVGLEDADDLIADLKQTLEAVPVNWKKSAHAVKARR
jgi:hypothetical protein